MIIEQHIAWAAAQKAQRRLVEWADNSIEHEGVKHYALPTPQQLASASLNDLQGVLKITYKRTQMLIELAQQIVMGELDLGAMQAAEPDALYQQLLAIKGIGHWTAAGIISRSKGIYAYVAHNDVALQAAVRKYFVVEKSAAATKAIFERYEPFAGLAAHFTLIPLDSGRIPACFGLRQHLPQTLLKLT